MAQYKYRAKDSRGKETKGTRKATDKRALAKKLRKEKLTLVKAERKNRKKRFNFSIPFFGSVPLAEKMLFTRNLQVMVGAGLSLTKALSILSEQTENKKLTQILNEVVENLRKGDTFSSTLEKYSDIFSNLYRNMIKVAEEAGSLEEVLTILANQLEKNHELKEEIKNALIYPTIIILAMIAIGIAMLVMVVPSLAATFEDLGVQLPLATRFVIGLATFITERWYVLIGGAIAAFLGFNTFIKTKKGRRVWDKILLKIPLINKIIKKVNAAYTARTLHSLLSSGVPIIRSLEIVSGTVNNVYFKEALQKSSKEIKKGENLSSALGEYSTLYPPMVIQMIRVGEETGETSQILEKVAGFFEQQVKNSTQNLAAALEPILMIIIGAAVGFFAISMIQPMYSMLGAL